MKKQTREERIHDHIRNLDDSTYRLWSDIVQVETEIRSGYTPLRIDTDTEAKPPPEMEEVTHNMENIERAWDRLARYYHNMIAELPKIHEDT